MSHQIARPSAALEKVARRQKLTIPESVDVLVDGFHRFQERTLPSSLSGVSFIRIAGQAACLQEENSRGEVRRVLAKIKPGGVFLVLGHGGVAPCGAVGAKQKALELASRGESLHEPESVLKLLENVSPGVAGLATPLAEIDNAAFQARKIYDDPEFRGIIERKNISVVWAVCSDLNPFPYSAVNRDWTADKIFERHPKLVALQKQMVKGLGKLLGGDSAALSSHYAHAAFLFDPMDLRRVLDPFEQLLDVGGICCVDARSVPNTPDGPKYLFRIPPNRSFAVAIGVNGEVHFSYDDLGSLTYSYGHVGGVNSLNAHGEKGNGHTVCLTTDIALAKAAAVRSALLENSVVRAATEDGKTITLAGFDGKVLRILNEAFCVEVSMPYDPRFNILSV